MSANWNGLLQYSVKICSETQSVVFKNGRIISSSDIGILSNRQVYLVTVYKSVLFYTPRILLLYKIRRYGSHFTKQSFT